MLRTKLRSSTTAHYLPLSHVPSSAYPTPTPGKSSICMERCETQNRQLEEKKKNIKSEDRHYQILELKIECFNLYGTYSHRIREWNRGCRSGSNTQLSTTSWSHSQYAQQHPSLLCDLEVHFCLYTKEKVWVSVHYTECTYNSAQCPL